MEELSIKQLLQYARKDIVDMQNRRQYPDTKVLSNARELLSLHGSGEEDKKLVEIANSLYEEIVTSAKKSKS